MDRLQAPRAFLVAAVLLAVGAGMWADRNSPEYALEQMIRALQMQERIRLEAFLDQRRIAENFVDQLDQQRLAEAGAGPGRPGADIHPQMSLGRGAQIESVRAVIRDVIDKLTDPKYEWSASEREAIHRLNVGRVRQAGRVAEAEIAAAKSGTGLPVRITARLERSGGVWRVVGLDGLIPLFQKE